MKYRTIVADPPWLLGARKLGVGGRRRNVTEVPYQFMTAEAICGLSVSDIAHDDARLFLWATRAVYRNGLAVEVAQAWGFEPVGEFIWGLRNPGTGSLALRNDFEPVLIADRGDIAPLDTKDSCGVYFWRQVYKYGPSGVPQKEHSAKPLRFMDYVQEISPGPYLELFARRQRLGWDTWGDEALEHVQLGGASAAEALEGTL